MSFPWWKIGCCHSSTGYRLRSLVVAFRSVAKTGRGPKGAVNAISLRSKFHCSQGRCPGGISAFKQNGHCFGLTSSSSSISSLRNPTVSRQPQSMHFNSQASIVRFSDSKWLYLQTNGHSSRSPCMHLPLGGVKGFTATPVSIFQTIRFSWANH